MTFQSCCPQILWSYLWRSNTVIEKLGIQYRNVLLKDIDRRSAKTRWCLVHCRFSLDAKDAESGIAFVDWTFRRVSNGTVIHQQRVYSTRMSVSSVHCLFPAMPQLNPQFGVDPSKFTVLRWPNWIYSPVLDKIKCTVLCWPSEIHSPLLTQINSRSLKFTVPC